MFLSADELSLMRADQARTLPDTAIIKEPTYTPDGRGGFDESYAAVAGGTVSCRADPIGSSRIMVERIAGKETMEIEYKVTFTYDVPLDADRRIELASKDYEIVAMNVDHSWRVCRTAYVARATNG